MNPSMNIAAIHALLDAHPWLGVTISTIAIIVVTSIVVRLGLVVLKRLARPHPLVLHMLEATQRSALWAACFIALAAGLGASPWEFKSPLLEHLVTVAAIATLTWWLVRVTSSTAAAVIEKFPKDELTSFHGRRVETQARLLARAVMTVIVICGLAIALMTFPTVRQLGTSLLASAGLAGVIVGLAARPIFANLLAGLQIALTQPIRLDDVVIVEGEWGVIEEIQSTYVVVRIWDDRRLLMPLQWFIDHPFQNWTRTSSSITGSVIFWVDYRTPIEALRTELKRICAAAPEWDGRFQNLQVTDTSEHSMQLRVLVTSADAGKSWDLRCRVREELLAYIQTHLPECLPRVRTALIHPYKTSMGGSKGGAVSAVAARG
jgi:small-conductance mechanosensitive channel